ncbi:hypothetical protein LIER_23981 [Lithospermum erythrorhizon]|uniref:Uncharacterized protein n=1 Tax=Lithospermum erythrorhizon TaxID=34254 RepID=A0AAV3R0Z7_LITER
MNLKWTTIIDIVSVTKLVVLCEHSDCFPFEHNCYNFLPRQLQGSWETIFSGPVGLGGGGGLGRGGAMAVGGKGCKCGGGLGWLGKGGAGAGDSS